MGWVLWRECEREGELQRADVSFASILVCVLLDDGSEVLSLNLKALILAPTRELAQQIHKVVLALGDYLKVAKSVL